VIRVIIADDHNVVRAGLEQLLGANEELEIVAAARNGQEAFELCLEHAPDVALMDLNMPVLDGIQATQRIHQALPTTRVVVLTSFSDRERILDALDAGAIGYLLKDAEPEELIQGIKAAARGESPLAPKAAGAVLQARVERRPTEELSARERQVLVLVGSGIPNKQIARRLGISEKTVKVHLTNVFRRIGVEDRTQAALWAERHGLLKPEAE
jgi:DNA-binding NarL/FixJ family response regulator